MNLLLIGHSETLSDLRYITGFEVADDVIWARIRGRSYLVLSPLEVDRGRRQAKVDHVLPLSDLEKEAPSTPKRSSLASLAAVWLLKRKITEVQVPAAMAVGHVRQLEAAGLRVRIAEDMLFPQREIKTEAEVRCMRRAQKAATAGFYRGLEILKSTRIDRRKRLLWAGAVLTSERLRQEIDAAILLAGGQPAHTIVAGGDQACDPHERGTGPLYAHQAIILDLFPRDAASGYFADMTRTLVRGRAGEELRKLYHVVLSAQQKAIHAMRPGVSGAQLQADVRQFFEEQGYSTRQVHGRWTGFFHGLGHSLGLDIHEPPRLAATRLQVGQVFTVEPGLYYPGVGGVRIEDMVRITPAGTQNLTRLPEILEI